MQARKGQPGLASIGMAGALLPATDGDPLHQSSEDTLFDQIPSEANSTQGQPILDTEVGTRQSTRPVWLDGASAAAPQEPPPAMQRPSPKLKRVMDASPFAGLMSKRPFRSRTFQAIHEEPEVEDTPAVKPAATAPASLPTGDTINMDNVLSRLPSVPSVVTTNTFMQVSISPQIWRAQEKEDPGGLMLNVGLRGLQLEGQYDLQLYLYSTMNPRIVTTGIPRPMSSGDLERHSSNGGSVDDDAEESSSAGRTRSGRGASIPMPQSAPVKRESSSLILDELFLVRRDPQRRIPDEVFHTRGPFEGGTVLCMPDWPGDIWRFDLCCKVSDGTEEVIWLKSLDKRLQDRKF